MSKTNVKISEDILCKPNGLLKLVFVMKEHCLQWNKDSNNDFRDFFVMKMRESFEECGELECGQYFDIALKNKFIIEDKDNTQKKYVLNNAFKSNAFCDWFCFDCDILVKKNSKRSHGCNYCWRVFHTKCSINFNFDPIDVHDYKCAYCKRLDIEREGFIGQKAVDYKRLNILIKYLLDFIKTKVKDKYNKFVLNLDSNQRMVVFKEMDLKMMEEKAVLLKYRKMMEFENDFFLFMHNITVTTIDFPSVKNDLCDLRVFYTKELKELRLCVDCYHFSNDKMYQNLNNDWFCEPCEPPHELKFVKAKFSPYWPAKVLEIYEDGRYNVRFFDKDLKRMDIRVEDTFPIDDLKIREIIKNNNKLNKPMKMLDIYLKRLKDKTGNSCELQPNNTCDQMRENVIKQFSSIEKIIENVVQMAYSKKSPQKRGRKPKKSLGISSESISIKKYVNQSSTLKSSLNTETAALIEPKVGQKLELEVLSSIKTKRASKRKSKLPKKFENNLPNITKENIDKTGDNLEINSEFEPMIVDLHNETDLEIIKAEVPTKTLNTTESESPIDSSQSQSITNTMSMTSINTNTNSGETKTNNTESQIIATNDNQNLNSNPDIINDSQTVCMESKGIVQKPISSKIDENQKIATISANNGVSTELELDESSKYINRLFAELLESNETDLNVIKQKIICIKYYHENQIKELKEKFEKELLETKKKLWCAVCHKLADVYCCVKFYCSADCLKIDWFNGHSKQCLTLNTNK